MAVTSIWRINGWLGNVVIYVENPQKTDNPKFYETSEKGAQGLSDVIDYAVNVEKTQKVDDESTEIYSNFVSGINCHPSTARDEMLAVKRRFGKEDGTAAYHGYQSFAPGEATPEMAHEIGIKLAERLWDANRPQSIIDIQAKLAAGKGEGYRRWATVENLKRMAKTKLYMDEHGLDYDAMSARKSELAKKEKELSAKITEAQNRIAEVNVLKTQIINYSKTRDVYVAYRKSGYSKKFYDEHEDDIIIHKAAKKAFDELGVKKLPTIKSLQVEFADLLTAKKEAYAELKKVRDELRDVAVHTANYEELRDLAERDPRKEKEHGRE